MKRVVDDERRRESLTPRQGAFVREMVKDPSSPTAAAVRAGYSKLSAKYAARKLLNNEIIQSILAQHFIDKEAEVSDLLGQSLVELRTILSDEEPETKLKAITVVLAYAKIAKSVLGLQVDRQPELPTNAVQVTEEDLLASLEAEEKRLRASIARRSKDDSSGSGEEALH